jgi:hypothetical protein
MALEAAFSELNCSALLHVSLTVLHFETLRPRRTLPNRFLPVTGEGETKPQGRGLSLLNPDFSPGIDL